MKSSNNISKKDKGMSDQSCVVVDKSDHLNKWRVIVSERTTELTHIVQVFKNRKFSMFTPDETIAYIGARETLRLNINLLIILMTGTDQRYLQRHTVEDLEKLKTLIA